MAQIRREIIEYGSLPIAKWLGGDDGAAAVQQLLHQLLDAASQNSQQQCELPLKHTSFALISLRVHRAHQHCESDVRTASACNSIGRSMRPLSARQCPLVCSCCRSCGYADANAVPGRLPATCIGVCLDVAKHAGCMLASLSSGCP